MDFFVFRALFFAGTVPLFFAAREGSSGLVMEKLPFVRKIRPPVPARVCM